MTIIIIIIILMILTTTTIITISNPTKQIHLQRQICITTMNRGNWEDEEEQNTDKESEREEEDDEEEDNNMPELQERDREDSESDTSDGEDSSDEDNDNHSKESISGGHNNEARKIALLQSTCDDYINEELVMPELICKLEKEDSSDDDSSEEDTPRQRPCSHKAAATPRFAFEDYRTRLDEEEQAGQKLSIDDRLIQLKEAITKIRRVIDEANNNTNTEDDNIAVGDRSSPNKRHTLTDNEDGTTTCEQRTTLEARHSLIESEGGINQHKERESSSGDEDLYFEPSEDEGVEESTNTQNNNINTSIENEAAIMTLTPTATKTNMKITQDNLPFGHICDDIAIDNDTPYIRVYCQNVCGIYDRDGIGLDSAFKEIKQAGADIFTFNETHGDDSNALARRALRLSKQRMWRNNNEDCKIVHSSSTAPVLTFTKPGGNLVGVTGSLVGRVRETITDPYGRWCGYTLIGKDTKEIMVLTAYNVSQYKNAKVGEDTLFNQQTALYKLNNIREPDPKQLFIDDLTALVKQARLEDKDIILTGDFNELVGDDHRGMTKVLSAGSLTDAHEHQHGTVDITTYTRGTKRLDYVFVTPRLVDHILRSGYESFHSRIASDHRGYFVDFAQAGLFDRQLPAIYSASSRAIRGTHPSNITKYVEHLHAYLEENDMYRKVKEQKNWYEKKQLEKLDRMITKGMLEAEDQCRIFHREPWSKEVNEVMTTANILRIHLSSLRTNIDCARQIQQKQLLLKKQIELPPEIKESALALSLAQKNCRKLIKQNRTDKTIIDDEQEAAFVAMNPEMDAKRAAQIFQRARDTKQMMSELPSKMNCPGGISALLVPLPKEGTQLEYQVITDGPTLEQVILQRNIRHFRQAETTPLATPEVIGTIGFGANTVRAEQILEGRDDPTDITDDEWSRFLLSSMKRNSAELKIEITAEKMMDKYKRWKERTSTSPSGRHLGHFHALFRPLKAKNKKHREQLDDIRQDIIDMHATMLQTAYENEHVFKRWEYIITCMLAKESGIPRIHRLRVIHLYECDLNLLFSIFFRELDQHCEDNFLINKGVYGCRPNRRAMDPVFVDVTQTEMAMVTRKTLIKFNNDATACFDRILVHLLSLCLRSYGMPKNLTTILGELLKVARYAIKTGIGISKETYQHSDESPAFGSGQGSGASAQGWTKLVSKLFDLHDKYGHGSKYADPWKLYSAIIGMLGFVDDNNITNTGDEWETVQDIMERTQHDAQLWNDLLRATGGALNLDKCFAQVLAIDFSLNGAPVIAPADPNLIITIKDRLNNKDVIVRPISPYKTYRSLGTEQGTSKNQKQQQAKLVKTSGTHQRKLACSAMSPKCAWVHYSAVFQSSVGYPLSMCHLSKSQLHELQKKYIPTLLNKLGIARTHAQVLVFGPRSYGGIGCNDLRIEQGLDAVQNLIRQLRTPGYGKQIGTIFLRTFQNASGLSKPLLQHPTVRAPHLEGHYYVHIRRFLAKHNASLEIDCVPEPTYERLGDEYIMDVVCEPGTAKKMDTTKLKHYTNAEIRQIYYCKSYLKVQRISDLCTADGHFILPSIAKGERSIRQCTSKLNEIKQEQPGDQTWSVWRKFLKTICKPNVNQEPSSGPRTDPRFIEPSPEPRRDPGSTEPRNEPTSLENRAVLNNNEGSQQRKDNIDRFSEGTFLLKYWKGVPYRGIVTSNKGKYYKILYEDNDEEELNHTEVAKFEKKNREEGRMTGEIGHRMRLIKPLGNWLIQANDSERLWPFYYSEYTDILYRSYRKNWNENGEFYYDCHLLADNDTYNYDPVGKVNSLPPDASPTDVMDTEEGWRVSIHQPVQLIHQNIARNETFMDYLMSQEEHVSQYYTEIKFLAVPIKIYKMIKSTNKVNIATDGGAIQFKGSLGFVIADEDGEILLSCYGQPSGNDPLSFRSEICAFLAAVRLVTLMTQYYDKILQCDEPIRSKIQVYTDSLSMINKLEALDEYPTAPLATVLHSEWDVLSALHKALKWFRNKPKISWVKSHQDDMVFDEEAMPLNAYLNSEADELATIGLKKLQEKPRVPMDPDTAIQFHIGDRTITRDLKRTTREIIHLIPLKNYYCRRFKWSDNIFDLIDWDIFRPVYKKYLATKGIQWMHKFCIKKLPTGERIHKKDHFHDQRCASCLYNEDDDHVFQCAHRRSIRKKVLNQINLLANTVDPRLCDIMREGLMTYFRGESVSTAMLRLRGQEDVDKNQIFKRYTLLIDEQIVIGWDNLLRGKFSKQWKIQQKAFITRRKLSDPRAYARAQKSKKRKEAKNNRVPKKKNKTEAFHAFFQAIIPIIQETWTDRCIDRNTPVLGGRIVAEYDSLTKKITHLYTLKEMVLPEDELKIFNEPLKTRLDDTNQQLKKWLNRWRRVIDHSMKRVKELAKENSKPIWRHYTKNKPAKTTVSRKLPQRMKTKKYFNNPLTNVFKRLRKKRSSSRVIQAKKKKYKLNHMISKMYTKLGKKRSTSRAKTETEIEKQKIDDRFGDDPI